MDAGIVGKALVRYNADVAVESAARYAAEHAEPAALSGLTGAISARLDEASAALTWLTNFREYTGRSRKAGFNSAYEHASAAAKMLLDTNPGDTGVRHAARGIANLGRATTATWGASHGRASDLLAHVNGLKSDIASGRLR